MRVSSRWISLVALCCVAMLAACGGGLGYFLSAGEAQNPALARLAAKSSATRYVMRVVTRLSDADGDGFPTRLCGAGCDCDDGNPAVFPGATDIAGNGIDEDCDGADSTVAQEEVYADLFRKGTPKPPKPAGHVTDKRSLLPKGPKDTKAAPTPPKKGPKPLLTLSRPGHPNVLLITIDTLRADHLGIYGFHRPTSPRIDAWAKTAVVFDQARSTGPSTRFSVPPMLIGKYFTEISRSRYEWPRIGDEETLLAERFKAAGFTTAAFHSIRYFRPKYNLNQGFDHYSIECLRKRGPPLKMISSDFITDEVLAYADKKLEKKPKKKPKKKSKKKPKKKLKKDNSKQKAKTGSE